MFFAITFFYYYTQKKKISYKISPNILLISNLTTFSVIEPPAPPFFGLFGLTPFVFEGVGFAVG